MIRHAARSSALLCGTALLLALPAHAQVVIDDERTEPVRTSTAGPDGGPADVQIGAVDDNGNVTGGSVTLDTPGPAVILDSSNDLAVRGNVTVDNVNDATAIELQGGADRNLVVSGTVSVQEDFEAADTDDDPFPDGGFAEGSGRRGILVSGASPFEGNITVEEAGRILVEGNESYAVDLSNTPVGTALDGDFTNNGAIGLRGDNGAAVRVAGGVSGVVTNNGNMEVLGTNSSAFDVSGDIGGFVNTGSINNNGFFTTSRARLPFNPDGTDTTDLTANELREAGSTLRFSGNVERGIRLGTRTETTVDADTGEETTRVVGNSAITQFGSAPAVIIDGEGTPIAVGTLSPITDPDADGFDADQLYAFVQQGTLESDGVFDEFDATVLRVADATLEGGILNTGIMSAETTIGSEFRAVEGVEPGTGLARVIVLGDNAIAEAITNRGFITATAREAADQVFFDLDNIPVARPLEAVAIDISETATLTRLENDRFISALLIGRDGTATVVRDASGTLSEVVNRGFINASGSNSDPNGDADTNFTLIALDLSANTGGVTFLQEQREDDDPDDDEVPLAPFTVGEIRLGSGDDSVTSTAGALVGGIDFGAGDDRLALSGTEFTGNLSNEDGLDISLENGSVLTVTSGTPVDITSASFDATSTFRPTVDGETGTASALQASGAISFAAGATIDPLLTNLINGDTIGNDAGTDFVIASAAELSVGDLAALNAGDDGSFLFDTQFNQVGDTLVVTVDLRNAAELGLDVTQTGLAASAFNATLQALQANPALGNEIANLSTAGEFYSAYNQLLPEFAAASRQFVVANSDGAVGAVANHLDSARRSPEKPGGAWLQEFAYFADRDLAGLSEQYRGEGFGFAAGIDTALGPFHAVGLNIGFASTEIEDVVGLDEPLDMTTLLGGLYAGFASGSLGVDAFVGGGLNEFEQNRRVSVGDFSGTSLGEWNGTHVNAGLRAGYDVALGERFWARPVISLDYLRLSEDAYVETGPLGLALDVDSRTSEMGALTGLLNFGATFQGQRTWIRPSVRVGYRNEFLSDPVLTSYRFAGIDNAVAAQTLSSDFPSSGVLVGFSVAAGSGFSSVGFDFDSDIRDGFIRHTGRIVVRLLF